MDFMARFWDKNEGVTRYLDSSFMGHCTANDMQKAFEEKVANFGFRKLLQLSMDGPNVNWAFHKLIQDKLDLEYDVSLLEVGSCGLHTVHNSFRKGYETCGWEISDFLQSLHTLWKDCRSRRHDYETVTAGIAGCDLWPLKFCKHRWLENVGPAQRATDLLPATRSYIEAVNKKSLLIQRQNHLLPLKQHVLILSLNASWHFLYQLPK
jgi:hypothetical protein